MSTGAGTRARPRSDGAAPPWLAALRIHPRIRARRVAVARRRGWRRLAWVVAVAGPLLAGLVALALLHSGWFEARHRLLLGAGHTPPAVLWRTAGITSATPLIDISAGAAEQRIESLPWVDRAVVRRRWPDTVEVRVSERRPVAVVGHGDGAVVVDRTGRALAAFRAAGGPALPVVVSAAHPVALGEWLGPAARPGLAVAAAVPPVLAGRVQQVVVGRDGTVTLSLGGGVTVDFGADVEIRAKFESLASVLADPASAPTGPAEVGVTDPYEPVVGPPGSA